MLATGYPGPALLLDNRRTPHPRHEPLSDERVKEGQNVPISLHFSSIYDVYLNLPKVSFVPHNPVSDAGISVTIMVQNQDLTRELWVSNFALVLNPKP
jgi:hypothetical protein